ncbi:MAG: SprT family zinc-dependent metalloprotease [Pseudomonadota bacterium]
MGLTSSPRRKNASFKQSLLKIADIEIHITRKPIKNMRMSISAADGKVKISAPLFIADKTINEFVNAQLNWIKKHQVHYQALPKPVELTYCQGEQHYFLGQMFQLDIVELSQGFQKVQIDGQNLKLYIKENSSLLQREKLLDDWYRSEIKKRIPELLFKWQLIIGKKVLDWRIRKMKTRWGTCNINKKRIWLNLELIKKSPECLEYVLVHEMVHLYERYHNQRFYSYMDQFLPNWKSLREQLKK